MKFRLRYWALGTLIALIINLLMGVALGQAVVIALTVFMLGAIIKVALYLFADYE